MANSKNTSDAALDTAGWMDFEVFLEAIHREVSAAQSKLATHPSDEGRLVIKDLRFDFPLEVRIVSKGGRVRIRFPSIARQLDEDYRDEHLSRVSFRLGYHPAD